MHNAHTSQNKVILTDSLGAHTYSKKVLQNNCTYDINTNLTLLEGNKKYTISNAMRNFGKDVT